MALTTEKIKHIESDANKQYPSRHRDVNHGSSSFKTVDLNMGLRNSYIEGATAEAEKAEAEIKELVDFIDSYPGIYAMEFEPTKMVKWVQTLTELITKYKSTKL